MSDPIKLIPQALWQAVEELARTYDMRPEEVLSEALAYGLDVFIEEKERERNQRRSDTGNNPTP